MELLKRWRETVLPVAAAIALPLAVGGLSSLLSGNIRGFYENLNRPAFAPPAAVFPVVWTVLLVLLGIASYLVWKVGGEQRRVSGILYGVNLLLIFLWPLVFFRGQAFFLSFLLACLLLIAALLLTVRFYSVRRTAGYLALPYLLWSVFAMFLSFSVYLLNR